MVTTNIRKARINDGAKFVVTITSEWQDGKSLTFKIIGDDNKEVVEILFFKNKNQTAFFKVHFEDLVAEGPLRKIVNGLVEEASFGHLDPSTWILDQLYG
jgi:hypothetical protein